MPPTQSSSRRRSEKRARADDEDDEQNARNTASTSRYRPADQESEDDGDRDVPMDGSFANDNADEQLVKKLVRYALACEYARLPIRRDGIRERGW